LADKKQRSGEYRQALELYRQSAELLPTERAALGKRECLDRLGKSSGDRVEKTQAGIDP